MEPTQCAITCTLGAPVASSTCLTAVGQSTLAMSSILKALIGLPESGLAR